MIISVINKDKKLDNRKGRVPKRRISFKSPGEYLKEEYKNSITFMALDIKDHVHPIVVTLIF